MSPLQTGALISGVIFGATKAVCTLMELAAGHSLVPINVGALITIGTTVSWIGFFSALNCQRVMTRLDNMETRLHQDIPGYGDLRADDSRVDAAREYARIGTSPGVTRQRGYLAPVE